MKSKEIWRTYLWVVKHLVHLRSAFLIVVFCNILISSIGLVIPRTMQYFTDEIYGGSAITPIFWAVGIVACSQMLLILARSKLNVWMTNLAEHAVQGLHKKLFEQLRSLGIAYTDRKSSGETLSLYHNEVNTAQRLIVDYLPRSLEHIFFLLFSYIYLASMNLLLSLIIVPFFLSYYLIGPKFEKQAAILGKESANKKTVLNQQLYNSVSATLDMRVVNAEKWDLERNSRAYDEHMNVTLKSYFNAYMRGTVRRLTVAFGSVAMFFTSAYFVQQGKLSLGEFVAFVFLYFIVIERLTFLVTNITEQRVLSHQLHRLFSFMNEKPLVVENDNPVRLLHIQGEIELRNVSFHYPEQQHQVIRGLNLTIRAGERLAVVGPSGQGKSTLIKLISRFYDPSQGRLLLDGTDCRELSLSQIRESIGHVFQETYLFAASIKENIRFGYPGASDDEVRAAARAANALEFIEALPQSFDTEIGERGFKLSGGQKQRLAIARMFIKNPPVVLLDEATSSLDNISEKEVHTALDQLLKGRTTVIVAHRLSTIKNADRIIVLRNGTIAEEGTFEQLIARRGTFYELVHGSQAESEPEEVIS